jgi:hypothetical protein
MKRGMMVFLVAVVAIAALMLFSGYGGAVQLTREEVEELNDTLFANATEIVTFKFDYKMDMNTTLEMLIGNETSVIEMTTWDYGKAIVEINETSGDVTVTGMGGGDTSIVNNTTGRKVEIIKTMSGDYLSMGTDFWYVKVNHWILLALLDNMGAPEMYEYFWVSQGLLNISDVELLEDEMVGDVNCSVLKIVPDAGEFWEIVINQSEDYEEWQDLSGFGNYSIMNVSTTQWVAKDTGFPVKTITTMRTMTSPGTEEEFRMTREIKHEMRFYDYNDPVSPVSIDTPLEEPESPENPPIGWPW